MISKNDRGSILILALWTLSLLTIFSVSVGYTARQKASLLSRLEDGDRLFTVAHAGVLRMASILIPEESNVYDTTLGLWANNPLYFKNIPVGDGTFTFETPIYDEATRKIVHRNGAVDEQSKINLNLADADTLTRLFRDGLEIGDDTSRSIAHAIIDWRDSDSFYGHPNYGAEDQDYRELSIPYEAKDAPFEVLEELLVVRGINQSIFDRIKPFVTVYGEGSVNINTASRPVLAALGLTSVLVDKIMEYRAGPDKELGNGDSYVLTDTLLLVSQLEQVVAINTMEAQVLEALADQKKLGVGSSHFRMEVRAYVEGRNGEVRLESVMNHAGKIVYSRIITGTSDAK